MPSTHARFSPSAANRRLHCPPSLMLEEQFQDEESAYAAEGTAGHAMAEHLIKKYLKQRTRRPVSDYYSDELLEAVDEYVSFIQGEIEEARRVCRDPVFTVEQRVDASEYVEGCFGTADMVIVTNGYIHIIDLKALMGDASDNIPGVKGVGEKTAMALVQRYQTVDALYAAMPEVEAKPAAIKKLAEGEESARMSYHLATIVTDAPLDFDPGANLRRPVKPELRQIFLRLEFNKLIEKMGLSAPEHPRAEKPKETDYTVHVESAADEAQAEKLLEAFRKAEFVTVLALPDLTAVMVQCQTGENEAVAG